MEDFEAVWALGLMSGTSMDGIDAALVCTDGERVETLGPTATRPYAPAVREKLREGIRIHNKNNPGSSMRIRRALLMTEPPQIDAGEITDKGYINQRAVLSRRAALVDRLYSENKVDIVVID